MNSTGITRKDIQAPRAGYTDAFPGGKLTFLSPAPLPTGHPPVDHGYTVGKVTASHLDFGAGAPSAFGWQMVMGGPFWMFLLLAVIAPVSIAGLSLVQGFGAAKATEVFWQVFDYCWWIAVSAWLFFFLLSLAIWDNEHRKHQKITPTRFNRQRREVCFVPEGEKVPVFVPWEDLVAWVTQAQGVTEYGVQRQYGFGIGYHHPDTDEKYTLEFQTYGLPQAISNWEAIRAYMEYEVHTLKEIQDPLELQGPDDPPWEGVHVFRNARKRLHQQYRDGEAGTLYFIGWYLYHLMTFWTIPNRLVEWEVKKLQKMNRRALPEAMVKWSEPLPESEWAKPSPELLAQSQRVRELHQANPRKPITEIFAQVSEEFAEKESMPA